MNLAEQTTIVGMIKRSIRDIAGEQKDEEVQKKNIKPELFMPYTS